MYDRRPKPDIPKKWLIRYVIGMGILWSVLWLGAVAYTIVTNQMDTWFDFLMLIGFTFAVPMVLGLATTKLNDWRSSSA